jgi:hypothetical protein
VIDKDEVRKNCSDAWGPKCDKAKSAQRKTEDKLEAARATLKTHGVEIDDSMAKRIVAYLPFLTREQVLLYQPLLLPLGLAIIGFLLIAIGARGGERPGNNRGRVEVANVMPAVAWPFQTPLPRPSPSLQPVAIAPPAADPEEAEIDPKPVVAFLRRKLPAARGEEADLVDIYREFLEDLHVRWVEDSPLSAAQFGLVLNYICKEARIRIERRGARVVPETGRLTSEATRGRQC